MRLLLEAATSSIWTGNEMIVWGGGDNTGTVLNNEGGKVQS